jgi:hypothetical protein
MCNKIKNGLFLGVFGHCRSRRLRRCNCNRDDGEQCQCK